jgi:hypothetical protein
VTSIEIPEPVIQVRARGGFNAKAFTAFASLEFAGFTLMEREYSMDSKDEGLDFHVYSLANAESKIEGEFQDRMKTLFNPSDAVGLPESNCPGTPHRGHVTSKTCPRDVQ